MILFALRREGETITADGKFMITRIDHKVLTTGVHVPSRRLLSSCLLEMNVKRHSNFMQLWCSLHSLAHSAECEASCSQDACKCAFVVSSGTLADLWMEWSGTWGFSRKSNELMKETGGWRRQTLEFAWVQFFVGFCRSSFSSLNCHFCRAENYVASCLNLIFFALVMNPDEREEENVIKTNSWRAKLLFGGRQDVRHVLLWIEQAERAGRESFNIRGSVLRSRGLGSLHHPCQWLAAHVVYKHCSHLTHYKLIKFRDTITASWRTWNSF